ncbi:MAG: metallophosphoesterase [Clostridia bacterium]|nr:metallophosphoesterase [Clostridia bacterium]
MNLFTIADLHLPLGADKPMDIFGGWDNYVERIENNWKKLVNKDDTVVIGGDISWAISLAEAKPDFEFINSLPGKKIILKGNHDYWWGTANKINEFLSENSFDTIEILHNNCYSDGNFAICGTRGWIYDGTGEKDQKVILREASRLETSIKFAVENNVKPLVFLHYPPVYAEYVCDEILNALKKYNIDTVYYGHIHGKGIYNAVSEYDGIKLKIVSADAVDFTPQFVTKCKMFEKV